MIVKLSCFYDPYCTGVLEYWENDLVSKIIIGLLHYSNSGVPINIGEGENLYVFCQIKQSYPKAVQFIIYCKNGHCVLEFGYNWIKVVRGAYSVELSDMPGIPFQNLQRSIEIAFAAIHKSCVTDFLIFYKVTLKMELQGNSIAENNAWYFGKALDSRVLPPICNRQQCQNLIYELLHIG